MSLAQLSARDLLSRFSYQNGWVRSNMIRIEDVPKVSPPRLSHSSSLGLFDRLPLEVLHLIFHNLDIRSLTRLSCVSSQGYTVIQSLSAYHDLIRYAPHALAALGRTGCICFHTLDAVHEALCSQNCAACGYFGAFLFLPTCERCCYGCLGRNQSFWVTSPAFAQKGFGINQHQIKSLPVIRGLPGIYEVGIRGPVSYKRPRNLVSVRAAKALVSSIHGSTMSMPNSLALCELGTLSVKDWRDIRYLLWLQKASIHLQKSDSVMDPEECHMPQDKYCGMASVPMPSLQNGELEGGFWCYGCQAIPYSLDFHNEREVDLALGVSIDHGIVNVEDIFIALQYRAWSKSGFLTHVRHCYGIQKLISGEWVNILEVE